MNIELNYPQPNGLDRKVYRFYVSARLGFSNLQIRLAYYAEENKKTSRHKWRAVRWWDMHRRNENRIEQPELPPNVMADVQRRIMDSLEFVR